MRLLVTGKTGQVASALQAAARSNRNVEVVSIGRPEWDLARADIVDAITAVAPDAVVNAAAYTAVDKAESEPGVALEMNARGAGLVAAAAARLGVPVIQLSTDYVFDGSKTTPYVETDRVSPISAYGQSKWLGEEAVCVTNADHVILRTSWVYGPVGSNFLRTMLRLAGSRDEVSVVDDQIGSPTFAGDIADAVIAIARRLTTDTARDLRGIFHLAGSEPTSWAGFAEEIFARSAKGNGPTARVKRISTAEYPTAARRPANSRLDASKLEQIYAIRIPPWRDGLARCMQQMSQIEESNGP